MFINQSLIPEHRGSACKEISPTRNLLAGSFLSEFLRGCEKKVRSLRSVKLPFWQTITAFYAAKRGYLEQAEITKNMKTKSNACHHHWQALLPFCLFFVNLSSVYSECCGLVFIGGCERKERLLPSKNMPFCTKNSIFLSGNKCILSKGNICGCSGLYFH